MLGSAAVVKRAQVSLQKHLDYIVDFEGFSLLFRANKNSTEFIQYRRRDYTKTHAAELSQQILEHLPEPKDDSMAAAIALQYLIKTSALLCYSAPDHCGNGHYWLVDRDTLDVFDPTGGRFTDAQRALIYAAGEACDLVDLVEAAGLRIFELMVQIQTTAVRFEVDEIITPDNKNESTFLREKWSMNYLYQRGVFGTFK